LMEQSSSTETNFSGVRRHGGQQFYSTVHTTAFYDQL